MTCLETFHHTTDQKGRRATIGIRRLDDKNYVLSYAITAKGDNFSRAKGRRIVSNRMDLNSAIKNRFVIRFNSEIGDPDIYSFFMSSLKSLRINISSKVLSNMLMRDLWFSYSLEELNKMKNKPEAPSWF